MKKTAFLTINILFIFFTPAFSNNFTNSIIEGDLYAVQSQILKDNLIVNQKFYDYENMYPIHIAVFNNKLGITLLLLKQNADIDCTDFNNNTPLHYAVINNNYDMVKLLLENGANCNIKNKKGVTPKSLANQISSSKIIELFTKNYPKDTQLYKKGTQASNAKNIETFNFHNQDYVFDPSLQKYFEGTWELKSESGEIISLSIKINNHEIYGIYNEKGTFFGTTYLFENQTAAIYVIWLSQDNTSGWAVLNLNNDKDNISGISGEYFTNKELISLIGYKTN